MPKITIYTKFMCPYCAWAKKLLAAKGAEWKEIGVTLRPMRFAEMLERSGGRGTAPQIFIGDRHIGGWDELQALDARGELDQLLEAT